jgi:hypothetical protein
MKQGDKVFVRTVTYHLIGTVKKADEDGFLILEPAVWVADSGRFAAAIDTGSLNEVEVPATPTEVAVSRGSIVDVWPWNHDIPDTTK